jgi:hypothetical protein
MGSFLSIPGDDIGYNEEVQYNSPAVSIRETPAMRIPLSALSLLAFLCLTPAQAAPRPAVGSSAQQAMNECALNYCGPRSPSVTQSKGVLVESCFRQKTGHSPAELGVSMPSLRCCPGAPCY